MTSSSDKGRAEPAAPGDYTWYAFCDPRTGEVSYGQKQTTGRSVLGGPFAGPRTVFDWIAKSCPTWRCDAGGACRTALGGGGEWKVLCGRQDGTVSVGTAGDVQKYMVLREGFLGEPEARAWVNLVYPGWRCTSDSAPSPSATAMPRMGGNWAVVCSKKHGGVGLTQHPDPPGYHIWGEGFYCEPDARSWTDTNCPSWRCDAQGNCLAGVAARRPDERPLELPPEGPRPPTGQDPGSGAGSGGKQGGDGASAGKHPTDPKPPAPPTPPAPVKPDRATPPYPQGTFSGEWSELAGTIKDAASGMTLPCNTVSTGGPLTMTIRSDGAVEGEFTTDIRSTIYRITGRVDASGQLTAVAECYLYRESVCWQEIQSCTLKGHLKSAASGTAGRGTISCGPRGGAAWCTGTWGR